MEDFWRKLKRYADLLIAVGTIVGSIIGTTLWVGKKLDKLNYVSAKVEKLDSVSKKIDDHIEFHKDERRKQDIVNSKLQSDIKKILKWETSK